MSEVIGDVASDLAKSYVDGRMNFEDLMRWRSAKADVARAGEQLEIFELYLTRKYGLSGGDAVAPDGLIKRAQPAATESGVIQGEFKPKDVAPAPSLT